MQRLFLYVLAAMAVADPAFAQTERFALQTNLDHVWTMTAAGLVFFMQGGFLLLEAGSVRSKNSINVAQKNLMDFVLSTMCFSLIGFALMFGDSVGGWVGFSREMAFFDMGGGDWSTTFFVFQLVFCGTAATIVSGAVAERSSMAAYGLVTVLLGTLIYPVAGHWAWGGLLTGSEEPWLAAMGFMDFAGSTVVHSVGGWVALAFCALLGPRLGRYAPDGTPVTLHGHSQVLSTFGAIIIFIGWIGFNGGSTLVGSGAFSTIIGNTFLSAAAGGLTMMLIGYWANGFQRPENLINGSLAGLVGITAGCDVMSGPSAVLIGVTSAIVYNASRRFLTDRFRIDDPVGAISVHGFAGAWGTLAIALFAPADTLLAGDRLSQATVQLTGIVVFFIWCFGLTFLVLKIAAQLLPSPDGPGRGLRVPEADEVIGLNVSEHDAPLGITGLVDGMQAVLENPEKDIPPIAVEFGEEGYEAAVLFNRIADKVRQDHQKQKASMQSSVDLLGALGGVIERVETGDLTHRLAPVDESSPFVGLPDKMNGLVAVFEKLVDDVAMSSEAVMKTARDLLAQSTELSENTTEQTLQLQELSTEIAALRQQSQETGDQIKAAVTGVETLKTVVSDGAAQFDEAAQRMENAARATDTISDALEEIDAIAFETRLLSLNASVEAARLTDASFGGFSVIAAEVRKLADATSTTAEKIKDVVGNVRIESKDAAERAGQARGLFMDVRDGMVSCANDMNDVGDAQRRSEAKMEQVGDALDGLKSRVNLVVAQAERTGDAAHRLEARAQDNEQTLARFQNASRARAA